MVRVRRRYRAANSHSAWINFRGAGHLLCTRKYFYKKTVANRTHIPGPLAIVRAFYDLAG